MIRKEITHEDVFTGQTVTTSRYFHLNKADMLRILSSAGTDDWDEYVQDLVSRGNTDDVMNFLEKVIRLAIGERTADGKFVKNTTISDNFIASEAYGELFVKIITDEPYAKAFFSGIVGSGDKVVTNTKNVTPIHKNREERRRNKKK